MRSQNLSGHYLFLNGEDQYCRLSQNYYMMSINENKISNRCRKLFGQRSGREEITMKDIENVMVRIMEEDDD